MVKAIICAILSFFIPGLGQAILGDLKKGIIIFAAALMVSLLANFVLGAWLGIIWIAIAIYAAYDAYIMANE